MNFQVPLTDDSLRAVLDTVLSDPAYQWTRSEPGLSWLTRWWNTMVDWLARFRADNPTAADVLFWSLVTLLAAIFVHGGWIMYQTVRGAAAAEGRAPGAGTMAVRDERWFRRLAETLAGQGRFTEAMQAAFTGQMLRWDGQGLLRFHPGKTPREYAAEARLPGEAGTRLRAAVAQLYACVYAGQRCGKEDYRAWIRQLDDGAAS